MSTWEEFEVIMKPILNAGLPAIGVIWALTHMVVHGPYLYQGQDIPDLFMEQCINIISQHCCNVAAKLMRMQESW